MRSDPRAQELQRYPRLHARLIEVVSELLRERLGPTTEYVQSLISIQTAYINTNHAAFRAGTEEYARRRAAEKASGSNIRGHLDNKRFPEGQLEEMPETANGSQEDEEDGYPVIGNGRPNSRSTEAPAKPSGHSPAVDRELHKIRSATGHDRRASTSTNARNSVNDALYGAPSGATDRPGHRSASASQHLHPNSFQGQPSSAPSSGGKDSFLNYFFGGASVAGGSLVDSGRLPRSSASDYGGDRASSNPLIGRKGHEGAAAAYDMKSLERHLDADQLPTAAGQGQSSGPNGVVDQDEMAIDLIQNLISTYFSIVRQTIQDLVPKAVMHLLINHSREHVQNRLVASLYKENLFEDLLYEDEGLTAERQRIKALLDSYKEGFKVRDVSAYVAHWLMLSHRS